MSRLKTITSVCAVVLGTALNAQAHVNPQDAVERCVNHVDSVAERAQTVIADDTRACADRIRRLIRAGRVEAAHAVARKCVKDTRDVVRLATVEITTTCDKCVRYLDSVGAFELARRVINYCKDSVASFDELLARQREILADALRG
ncbi:MAG: hypothetical protein GY903_06010 [Fuerstiella sp.]|nr:hypothetical protein [Fuerstiella sp.]